MGKKIQESYLRLSNAIADLPDGPACAKPEYRDWFFVEPQYEDGKVSFAAIQREMRIKEVDAKLICDFCPVRALCAEYAILANEPYGIWGATSPADRKAISSARSKPGQTTARQLFD